MHPPPTHFLILTAAYQDKKNKKIHNGFLYEMRFSFHLSVRRCATFLVVLNIPVIDPPIHRGRQQCLSCINVAPIEHSCQRRVCSAWRWTWQCLSNYLNRQGYWEYYHNNIRPLNWVASEMWKSTSNPTSAEAKWVDQASHCTYLLDPKYQLRLFCQNYLIASTPVCFFLSFFLTSNCKNIAALALNE